MRKREILRLFFLVLIVSGVAIVFVFRAEFRRDHTSELIKGVNKFEHLVLGGEMPLRPGDMTFAPYKKIPPSKFYVNIASVATKAPWCIQGDCSSGGAYVETMGGWLQMENSPQAISEIFNLNLENNNIKSLVIVGDQNAKIVGIFPNRGLQDLIPILKLYPKIVNFELLKGVNEFGPLKVGSLAPIKPGDPTGYKLGEQTNFPYKNIPKGKKFYIYAIQKYFSEKANKGYCAFYECLWYEEFDYIEEMGGWYSNDGRPETIKMFGLKPYEVKSGKASVVVVTDSKGIIAAIHPGKTKDDFISILKQLPELVDVEKIYRQGSGN